MKMMVFRGGEAGGLTVSGTGFGRAFADGSVVDFDEVAGHVVREVPGTNDDDTPKQKRIAVTWGDAIGEKYAHLFEPAGAPTKSRRRTTSDASPDEGAAV